MWRIVAAVVVVLVLLVVFWMYYPMGDPAQLNDCAKYGDAKAVGAAGGPTCAKGKLYQGKCYEDKPCQSGYTKSTPAQCVSGNKVVTIVGTAPSKCPAGRQLYQATCVKPCPSGYHHTAPCICTKNPSTKTEGGWWWNEGLAGDRPQFEWEARTYGKLDLSADSYLVPKV